jgi:NAD(P)-dependent dehydrogenase (short-subunit alcohol dehydrogenase family)
MTRLVPQVDPDSGGSRVKNVVITGSTKGLGRGLAQQFLTRGHSVVISGRSLDDVRDSAAELAKVTQGPARVLGGACDVSKASDVQALWDLAVRELGRVDVWINNAGLAKTTHTIETIPLEQISQMVATNVIGTMVGSKVALLGMKQQGAGQIFNVLGGGSDGKLRSGMGVYGSTKRALKYFTDALEKENAGGPVQIGQIRPGMIMTHGVLREAAEMDPSELARQRRIMNILFDHVETVAPYLVDEILASRKHAARIAWMTPVKMLSRFMTASFKKRDVLSRYAV